jgi:alkylation response protein AidB-like acyl-CoA dehydrogenase
MEEHDESPEEAALRAEARAWLEANAPADYPAAAGGEYDAEYVKRAQEWQATLADGGWGALSWPVEHGGRGLPPTQAAIFGQEQARVGIFHGLCTVGLAMAGPTIIAHGTEDQRRRYLPPLVRGEELWCQLFSEPGAGSDLAGLSCRAVPDGDEYVVNGQKVWTSGAQYGHWGILLARTDPDQPKHRGITYFLLDMHTPGIEVRPLRQMTGGSHFNEVFLTDVRIPAGNVLGDVNAGWGVAMTTLASERAFMGGGGPGRSFDELLVLARRFGQTADASVRQELAAAYTRFQLVKYLGQRARVAPTVGMVMKLFYAEHLRLLGDLALAVQGPYGGLVESDRAEWTQQFLSAPSIRIAGGSDEIQRNIIGERVLGLPPDIRTDKGVPFRTLSPS